MKESIFNKGDIFLLFHQLHYDFHTGELPIAIFRNLYFDETPSQLLNPLYLASQNDVQSLLKYTGLVNMLLPGHTLPGMGIVHCCLRYDSATAHQYVASKANTLFSTFITALRLKKPCPIIVGGRFEYGSTSEPLKNPTYSRLLTSPYNPRLNLRYNKDDVLSASFIAEDLMQVSEAGNKGKIRSALIYFSQITQGFSISLQLCYLGLWAALEGLFSPTGSNKAQTISNRISTYLASFHDPNELYKWCLREYRERRSKFIHGSHIALPNLQNIRRGGIAFQRLHEITRLCLLGFLSLNVSERNEIFLLTGKKLQKKLDNLGKGKGRYLENQKMYLEE